MSPVEQSEQLMSKYPALSAMRTRTRSSSWSRRDYEAIRACFMELVEAVERLHTENDRLRVEVVRLVRLQAATEPG